MRDLQDEARGFFVHAPRRVFLVGLHGLPVSRAGEIERVKEIRQWRGVAPHSGPGWTEYTKGPCPGVTADAIGGEMGDCGVCLSGYDGECEFFHQEIRTARKPHVCSECGKPIPVGEKYEHASGQSDDELWDCDTCLICAEIAEAFYCDGRTFGGWLWENMADVMGELTTGCLDCLQTANAKAELMRRWNEWRFRTKP